MSDSVKNIRTNVYLNDKNASKTLRQLHNESKKLRNQLQHLPRDSKEFARASQDFRKVRKEIRDVNKELYAVDGGWSKMANGVNKYFNLAMAGVAALTGVVFTLKEYLSGMGELSDLRADVQKVTDLSEQQMNDLQDRFDRMNTRTPRAELLKLAEQAGKMGMRGTGAIADFVEQANELNVALGEDLGEDAVLQIGKMSEVFEVSIRKMGSGINAVADNSKASAGFLTDFLARLGGTAKAVGISADEVMGYGATLDELGLKVEMSSTALNGFFTDFIKNTDEMASVAGFAEGELQKLIGEQGTNAGFLALLERLQETSQGSDDFLRKLEALGVTGDRGSQVFLALSQNLELVRQRQALANEEIEKGDSLTREYNRKNETLQADLEVIGRTLRAKVFSSGAMSWLQDLVKGTREYLQEPLSEQLREDKIQMNALFEVAQDTNITQEERAGIVRRLNDQFGEYLGNLLDEESSLEAIAQAQREANSALSERIALEASKEVLEDLKREAVEAQKEVLNLKQDLAVAEERVANGQFTREPESIKESLIRAQELAQMAQQAYIDFEGSIEQSIIGSGTTSGVLKSLNDKLMDLAEATGTSMAKLTREYYRGNYESFAEFESLKLKKSTQNNEDILGGEKELTDKEKEELLKRAKERLAAEQRVQEFLAGLDADEKARLEAKFAKMLELAAQYGLERKQLEAALAQELRTLQLEQEQEAYEAERARKVALMENSLRQLWEYEQGLLTKQFNQELITQETYQEQMEALELAHLTRMLQAREALGLDTLALEKQIAEQRIAASEKVNKARESEMDTLARNLTQTAFFAGARVKQEESAGAAIINAIRDRIQAYLAETIAKAIVDSFKSTGLGGLILGPAMGAAAGAIFNAAVPRFNIGGYTGVGVGTPDPQVPGRFIKGLAHDGEYIVASEELARPDVSALVGYIEDLRSQRVNHSGGTVVQQPKVNQKVNMEPMIASINRLNDTLNYLQRKGIVAVADNRFRRDLELLDDQDQFINQKSRF